MQKPMLFREAGQKPQSRPARNRTKKRGKGVFLQPVEPWELHFVLDIRAVSLIKSQKRILAS
ncbi:hypothetical protein SAMN02745216_04360 [Desulfatibacillum alkenivorans DSM 16219]|uniref:Uncharacterized protein n=1 Tax=Desulfatibacillum alkenivorans DSM 16219 TaxID=1121393 RepID=A0A1M6WMX1_9BACT|nr:hypothetical protein SAMN02745216_04360 [Desulfatibacillum alkenivorans DSM 16219]